MTLEPIAIIGLGCRYPGADSPDAFWRLLKEGVDAVGEVPSSRWDKTQFQSVATTDATRASLQWGGFLETVDQFDPLFFGIAPREVNTMDPQQRLMLEVAWEAIEDAGIVPARLRGTETGVFVGIGTHDYSVMLWRDPIDDPYLTTGTGNCVAANRISYVFDLKGPSLAVDTACSSSLIATHLACQSLWTGECEMALVGGVNLLLLPTVTLGFARGGFMSSSGRCRSFDARADGYVRSEGAGMVLLKPLSQALADADPIYAVIRGTAANQDGFSHGLSAPNGAAQERVLRMAYRRAGIAPGQVQYIEAHGTGTRLGDPIEITALSQVLAEGREPGRVCAVGSVKSNIGHTETAAGVAGLIKVALSLKHRQIPPNLHFQTPNPQIEFDRMPLRVPTQLMPWPAGRAIAGVNSFGFGGTNAHVVLEEAPAPTRPRPEERPEERMEGDRPRHLFTLSTKTAPALRDLVQRYDRFLASDPAIALGDLCFTANTRRSLFHHRLAVVAESTAQLQQQLRAFVQEQETPHLICGVATSPAPAIAFLFTGQGAQVVNMGRQLYQTQPLFRQIVDEAAQLADPLLEHPLLSVLYPASHLEPSDEAASPLTQTAYAQPALFVLEYALARLWMSWGVRPALVMGHSLGEYVAACIAGVFSLEAGIKLVAARGRLMQSLPQTGGMLSVQADRATVEAWIAQEPAVGIAALNGPESTVLSGERDALARLVQTLTAAGIKATPLNVSHAFHSPLMAPMLTSFAQVAASITYHLPEIPLVSNVTGNRVSHEVTSPDYWCEHVCQPVRFMQGMAALQQLGCDAFVEIGPKPVLLGMGRLCWQATDAKREAEALWLPSLRPGQDDWQTLLTSLATLHSRGVPVNWAEFDRPYARQVLHLPTYPFQRQRYWWEAPSSPPVESRAQASTGNGVSLGDRPDLHPLLGERLRLGGTSEIRFESRISATAPAYLIDHQIATAVVFPAASYLEMALAAGQSLGLGPIEITQFHIEQALLLSASEPTILQLVLTPESEGYRFQILSLPTDSDEAWVRHASGVLCGTQTRPFPIDVASIQAQFPQPAIAGAEYYRQLRLHHLNYGTRFQVIQQLWHADGTALSQVQLPDSLVGEAGAYHLHPVMLDGGLQTVAGVCGLDTPAATYLPTGIQSLRWFARPQAQVWSRVKQVRLASPGENGSRASQVADLQLINPDGTLVAEILGLRLHPVSEPALMRLLGHPQASLADPPQDSPQALSPAISSDCVYELTWQPDRGDRPPVVPSDQRRRWLILSDRQGVGTALASALERQGDGAALMVAAAHPDAAAVDGVNLLDAQAMQRRLADLAAIAPITDVVYLWSLDAEATPSAQETLTQTCTRLCGGLLHLVQALAPLQHAAPRLWLVTAGTQAITPTDQPRVSQSALWGFARTLHQEQPDLRCTCIDLDASDPDPAASLLAEMGQLDLENHVAYRQGLRYVARLRPQSQVLESARSVPESPSFRLGITQYGALDNLTLMPSPRRSPAPHEVEIEVRAAGVNFRDVLNALGMLQPYLEQMGFATAADVPFGGECAGLVVAVGEGVTHVQVGDDVIAAQAIGSLGQYTTVNAKWVVRKPRSLSFAAAATLPTAFLTAVHGLCHLANLQRGDRVLIHAAAGGVGLAAVQVAQRCGAEVYATASAGKQDFLKALGVQHVFDSRTLDFAAQIAEATGGRGVDVVLNSLNGDYIPRSLDLLASGGRFVEIGKIGIWTAAQIQAQRPDVDYFSFDLLDISRDDPDYIATLLNDLIQQFEAGEWQPLRHTVFDISAAATAFRFMAQAKHIGKVVITLPPVLPQRSLIRPDASYLITGGSGALGQLTAQWLIAQGATCLVLVGRSAPAPEMRAWVEHLETRGVKVTIAQVDMTQREAIASLLDLLPLPLRGVIHAAGVLDDGIVQNLSWERFAAVFAPKVEGAWNLHDLTRSLSLDFFVCFSSIASLLGSAGQANYAAANAVLDGLMHYRRSLGLPGLSINWGAWTTGMSTQLTERERQRLIAQGLTLITPELGLPLLQQLLRQHRTQAAVLPIDWLVFQSAQSAFSRSPLLEQVVAAVPTVSPVESTLVPDTDSDGDSLESVEHDIRSQLAKVLGFTRPDLIDLHDNFADLGMDSLMAVELTHRLQAELSPAFSQSLLFDYPTVASLADYVVHHLRGKAGATSPSVTSARPEPQVAAVESPRLPSPLSPAAAVLQPTQRTSPEADASWEEGRSCWVPSRLDGPGFPPTPTLSVDADVGPEAPVGWDAHPNGQPPAEVERPSAADPDPDLEAIPERYYQFHLIPEYQGLKQDLSRVEKMGNPFFAIHAGTVRDTTTIGDQTFISYASYNYLGMSGEPSVTLAAIAAVQQYGTSVSASRVLSGERPIHRALEQELAQFLGTEDCLVFVSGHATNVTTIGHLFGERDLILYDALSHNSIREGCNLSGATLLEFPHNDWQALEQILSQHRLHYEKVLIVVEGIYSADGDIAPLPQLVALKKRFKTFLMVDEAHSIGVLGQQGRGIREHFGISAHDVDVWMGTLSKSFASCGGYIAGSGALIEYMRYTSPGFVYSVGMTPSNTAAALASLRLLQQQPERCERLRARSHLFLSLAKKYGLNTGSSEGTPIIPIIVGEPQRAIQLCHRLAGYGIHVQPMIYPSVPHHLARLRFFLSCLHTEEQIHFTVSTLAKEI